MDITNRAVIKKNEYAQVNLITCANGDKFIEKIYYHIPPVLPITFQYDHTELDFIESIIEPLGIPHTRIINSDQDKERTTYIIEFIDGINCGDEPQAEYLYIAAEKIGAIYHKSKINMTQIDKSVVKKYTLTKEKILNYIKVINTHFNLPPIDSLIDYIFEKYHDRTMFVNHHDMQFKNFIFNDDLHIIDWGGCIHTFFSDLYSLIQQADEVDADINEIKKRYLEYSQIRFITDEDICIGGIIACIRAIFELMIFDCPVEWAVDSYNELQRLIQKVDFH